MGRDILEKSTIGEKSQQFGENSKQFSEKSEQLARNVNNLARKVNNLARLIIYRFRTDQCVNFLLVSVSNYFK